MNVRPGKSDRLLATRVRHAVLWALAGIATGLLILYLFDLLRPARSLSLGTLLVGRWPAMWRWALACVLLGGWCWLIRRWEGARGAALWVFRAAVGAGLLAMLPFALMMIEGCVYEPIKFRWLIQRIETASTPEEERAAFRAAARWGRVWEVHRLNQVDVPARAGNIDSPWVLEIEWLESGPGGKPYRAYRKLVDEKNLGVLCSDGRTK